MHFKDHNNALYFLSAEDIARGGRSLIPANCVEITDTEADEIRAAQQPQPDPAIIIIAQIDAIERDTLMNRATREWMLMSAEREAARDYSIDLTVPGNLDLVQAGLYAGNLGYRKVKDIDNQIAALRAQIGAA